MICVVCLYLFDSLREVFEQGKRAFVSFVHFYYKHECKLIFQAKGIYMYLKQSLKHNLSMVNCVICLPIALVQIVSRTYVHHLTSALDLVGLAQGYGLPHLPRMPELKDKDLSTFIPHSTPPSSIPFKDKAREKKRKALLQQPGI